MEMLLPGLELPEPALPEGMAYVPDYLGEGEAAALLRYIEAAPWRHEIARPRQFYGGAYQGAGGQDAPLPEWLIAVAEGLVATGHMRLLPNRVLVNGYKPGQGIGAHVDDPKSCGAEVAILSLGSATDMIFAELKGEGRARLRLAPRSLLMLTGKARYDWSHAIPARKSDRVGGMHVVRRWRVSVTFRTGREAAG